jgi:hypothetical protein
MNPQEEIPAGFLYPFYPSKKIPLDKQKKDL